MTLGHIERNAVLSIFEQIGDRAVSDEYEAVYKYLEEDKLFIVQCKQLAERYDNLDRAAHLNITLKIGPYVHTFTGNAQGKRKGGMVLIEQLTDIMTFSRRQFDRDELRVGIRVFDLPKTEIAGSMFEIYKERHVLSDLTFDLSAGGFCIITNQSINAVYDPYYLAEFAFSEKDYFRLPSQLVRRENCQRTKIGRNDYGFEFIFENLPEEQDRLENAIVIKKLASLKL